LSEPEASMPTRDDVRGWSAQQRASVARLLAESIDQSPAAMRSPGRRRLVLAVGEVGALFLLPWLVLLSATLPATSSGGAWRTVWVGFDELYSGQTTDSNTGPLIVLMALALVGSTARTRLPTRNALNQR